MKTAFLFWIWIPIVLAFYFFGPQAIDMIMHDTYLVIANYQIVVVSIVIFLISGLGYSVLSDKLIIQWLKKAHVFFTYVGAILFIACIILNSETRASLLNDNASEYLYLNLSAGAFFTIFLSFLFLLIAIIAYIANIIFTIIKSLSTKKDDDSILDA